MRLVLADFRSGLFTRVWTADRAAAYCWILLGVTVVLAAADVVTAAGRGGWDLTGKPLGTDFLCFWSAARLAVQGAPASAYAPAVAHALERAAVGGVDPGYYAFIYPPMTLVLCWPLGLLPYFAALPVWLATTGLAYAATVWAWVERDRRIIPAILAFPGVLLTCGHGQNAFLTAALFGGGLLFLGRDRPVLAGLLLGSLVIKPHLGLLIPFYLIATGQGRAAWAAGFTVAAWVVVALAVFGPEPWRAYLGAASLARSTLEQGFVEPEKLQSVFAAVRLWHGPLGLAYAAQGATALAVAGALIRSAWGSPDRFGTGAMLVVGTLLTTPYVLDYDLTLLAVPLAWLFAEGRRTGFLAWEREIALAAYLLPLFSRLVATGLGVPLGPCVLAALFWVLGRRLRARPPRDDWRRSGRAGAQSIVALGAIHHG